MHVALRFFLTILFCSSQILLSQNLRLKTRVIETNVAQPVREFSNQNATHTVHVLVQFGTRLTSEGIRQIQNQGGRILADLPTNGLLVAVPAGTTIAAPGMTYAAPIHASDKLSRLATSAYSAFIVEFHADADMNQARGELLNAGAEIIENPDLNPQHLLIQIRTMKGLKRNLQTGGTAGDPSSVLSAIAANEDVAYVFPASEQLIHGVPVRPCMSALTTNGAMVQSIPTYGEGWDGPGLGAATLSFVYSKITAQLPAGSVQSEIQRAMMEWSKVVQVSWKPGTNPNGTQTVNILFASGAHGDPYPFDGPGGVLAHTFYPAPSNPEPIAGDMHLDDSESWHIGANTDLFSVTLHELGHALGLGHSDDPTAVMYPYYNMVSTLAAPDKAAILTLYAAQTGTPAPIASPSSGTSSTPAAPTTPSTSPAPVAPTTPTPTKPVTSPAPAPLSLTVNSTSATTTAASISLSGSAAGGTGNISISWTAGSASGLASGAASAWSIGSIPLNVGSNTIMIVAFAGSSSVSRSVTITRQSSSTTTGGTPSSSAPPTLTIASPGATTVSTSAASITITGTATGATSVTWKNTFGQSGVASGTASWSMSVPLLTGSNSITITATNASGVTSWRSVVVTRH